VAGQYRQWNGKQWTAPRSLQFNDESASVIYLRLLIKVQISKHTTKQGIAYVFYAPENLRKLLAGLAKE
jgi:hypothetical protein